MNPRKNRNKTKATKEPMKEEYNVAYGEVEIKTGEEFSISVPFKPEVMIIYGEVDIREDGI